MLWRNTHCGAACPNFISNRADNLCREARTMSGAAPILIITHVGAGIHEFMQQVAIGAMDFNPISSGVDSPSRAQAKSFYDLRHLLRGQWLRNHTFRSEERRAGT